MSAVGDLVDTTGEALVAARRPVTPSGREWSAAAFPDGSVAVRSGAALRPSILSAGEARAIWQAVCLHDAQRAAAAPVSA